MTRTSRFFRPRYRHLAVLAIPSSSGCRDTDPRRLTQTDVQSRLFEDRSRTLLLRTGVAKVDRRRIRHVTVATRLATRRVLSRRWVGGRTRIGQRGRLVTSGSLARLRDVRCPNSAPSRWSHRGVVHLAVDSITSDDPERVLTNQTRRSGYPRSRSPRNPRSRATGADATPTGRPHAHTAATTPPPATNRKENNWTAGTTL